MPATRYLPPQRSRPTGSCTISIVRDGTGEILRQATISEATAQKILAMLGTGGAAVEAATNLVNAGRALADALEQISNMGGSQRKLPARRRR